MKLLDGAAHPAHAPITTGARIILAAVGTSLAVGLLEVTALWRNQPYPLLPFVTSIALVMGLPDARPSRARALVGGHIVSALSGYAVLALGYPHPAAAAFATGLSVAAMLLTRTMHPPAAINPFLIVNDDLGADFLFETVVPGALLLGAFAWGWHRVPSAVERVLATRSGAGPSAARREEQR